MLTYNEQLKADFIYADAYSSQKIVIETNLTLKGRGIRKTDSSVKVYSYLNIDSGKEFTYFVTVNAWLKLKSLYTHTSVDALLNCL